MSAKVHPLQVAVNGYDAVAYFAGRPTPGDPLFASTHDGSVYHFATEANKTTFDANPAKYVPLYGGYCATAASEGKLFGVDPTNFKVTADGKLALFYRGAGGDTLPQWNENEAERRAAADKHWADGTLKAHD